MRRKMSIIGAGLGGLRLGRGVLILACLVTVYEAEVSADTGQDIHARVLVRPRVLGRSV
jgi:hypothetical protein